MISEEEKKKHDQMIQQEINLQKTSTEEELIKQLDLFHILWDNTGKNNENLR